MGRSQKEILANPSGLVGTVFILETALEGLVDSVAARIQDMQNGGRIEFPSLVASLDFAKTEINRVYW
jgi:hypothetical protein